MSLTVPLEGFGGSAGGLNFKESATYPGCYFRTIDGVTEWLNPPMVVGTEYRTVERFKGAVVYAKAVSLGALPNATQKTVSVGIANTKLVSIYGHATDSDGTLEYFPIYNSSTGTAAAYLFYTNKKLTVEAYQDLSGYTGTAFIKYTK